MSLNKVMLIGNVGRDPEVRYLDGNAVNPENRVKMVKFTLATSERYRDRNGEPHENTEWHSIVAYRGAAEYAEKYVRKGTSLFVEGRIRTSSWTDQAGNRMYRTVIQVENMQTLGRRPDAYGQQGAYQRVGQYVGGAYGQESQGGAGYPGQRVGTYSSAQHNGYGSGASTQQGAYQRQYAGGAYGQDSQGGAGYFGQRAGTYSSAQHNGYGSDSSEAQEGSSYDSSDEQQAFGSRSAAPEAEPQQAASSEPKAPDQPVLGVDDLPF